jgi:hypothetical protein
LNVLWTARPIDQLFLVNGICAIPIAYRPQPTFDRQTRPRSFLYRGAFAVSVHKPITLPNVESTQDMRQHVLAVRGLYRCCIIRVVNMVGGPHVAAEVEKFYRVDCHHTKGNAGANGLSPI